ncbi:hypothetical protein OOU_Y34scaffold00071g69 [Pyricularia oryzae Y34]|uniref:Uncharacterized protein n=1 Tax=Pyricularia oryzae (strain Y34) TaxID=1143189 RepID=A0AA97P9T7_PYRO3|nr:hypothetical protein OOU_Y34scaffold00071g69 [Pyricularia oryzae Y34]
MAQVRRMASTRIFPLVAFSMDRIEVQGVVSSSSRYIFNSSQRPLLSYSVAGRLTGQRRRTLSALAPRGAAKQDGCHPIPCRSFELVLGIGAKEEVTLHQLDVSAQEAPRDLLRVTEDICVKFATSSRRSSWCWTPLAARNPSNQVEDDEDEDDVDVMPVHSQLAKSIGPSLLSCQREPDHLEESLAPPRIVRNTPGSKSKKTFAEGWGQAETVRLLHSVTRDEMESVTALDRPAGPARLGGEPDGVGDMGQSTGDARRVDSDGGNKVPAKARVRRLGAMQ